MTEIVYHINLYQELHKTVTSNKIAEQHHSSVKISEHGVQWLHKLYMQDKSSKPKNIDLHLLKACRSWQFKQLQYTALEALIDSLNFSTAT